MNSFKISGYTILVSISLVLVQSCKPSTPVETKEEGKVEAKSTYKEAPMISPDEFEAGMKKNRAVLVDVRMPQEFEKGHMEGAVNMNFFDPNFKAQLLDLDKDKKYYMYCKNDARSERAAEFMLQNDFPEVYVLKGGYDAWLTAGKQ
ncbi:MAG TPA: rhodanese-like domain-containing protein [Saprospiraceae bacterium]|nr:rhodanese-like domain-containing protein [Saprospiraceae bacterium]